MVTELNKSALCGTWEQYDSLLAHMQALHAQGYTQSFSFRSGKWHLAETFIPLVEEEHVASYSDEHTDVPVSLWIIQTVCGVMGTGLIYPY